LQRLCIHIRAFFVGTGRSAAWCGDRARSCGTRLPDLAAFSPGGVFFAQSARPRTDAPLVRDVGDATQREQRLAGAYQGCLVMRGQVAAFAGVG
jgi:hypothetical protein